MDGGETLTFTYNKDGVRTSKGNIRYILDGSTVIGEERDDYNITYLLDENGSYIGFVDHNNLYSNKYYYVKNQQGDVVQLLNENLEVVANYSYNAWGLLLSVTDANGNAITAAGNAANINPIRYRGYYYDTETGFYYCGSRYYAPESCRFISPDNTDVLTASPMAMTDKNLYTYCDNNPVMRADYGGEFWHIVAGAVIGGISSFASTLITGGSLEEALISSAFGAASGALTAAFPGAGLLIDVGFSVAEEVTMNLIEKVSLPEATVDTAVSVGVDSLSSFTNEGSRLTKETMRDFANAVPRTLKGNHPRVKRTAERIVRKTSKTIARETGETIAEKTAGNFFKSFLKAIF